MLDWLVEIPSLDTRERNLETTSHLRDSEDEAWELPLVACGRQLVCHRNMFRTFSESGPFDAYTGNQPVP